MRLFASGFLAGAAVSGIVSLLVAAWLAWRACQRRALTPACEAPSVGKGKGEAQTAGLVLKFVVSLDRALRVLVKRDQNMVNGDVDAYGFTASIAAAGGGGSEVRTLLDDDFARAEFAPVSGVGTLPPPPCSLPNHPQRY